MCVHLAGGTTLFMQFIFLVHIAIAMCVCVGYYTRIMTCLLWFMTISLHNRNHLVLHSGDILMRLELFFAMFLPLGEVYSIDSAFFKNSNNNKKTTTR